MPLDHYVTLGRSGLRVSPFCLGAMTFGEEWGWGSSVKESERILDHFIDRGGNFIDTANAYTKGHSEKIIGDHVGRDRGKRDRLVIATKFMSNLFAGDPNGGGASRKAIMQQCEESLRRLQTDCIDLYWLHVWDRFTPVEETLAALDQLVRQGKVRYVGFSDTPAWKVAEAQTIARYRDYAPLIALQIEYSLLQRTVEGELTPMALELGLGVTPWSPLASGVLTGKYAREEHGRHKPGRGAFVASRLDERAYAVVDVLRNVARDKNTTAARVALAWLRAKPAVVSPIVGARTLEQLDDNLAALEVKLDDDETARLDEASRPQLAFPADFVARATTFYFGGTTVDGRKSEIWPMAPQNDAERY
jgi:aryl-alcohol dehydrogenase-like predicted oxidoreductase